MLFFTDNKLGAVEQRWVAQLAQFDCPGRCNRNADALSRRPSDMDETMTKHIKTECTNLPDSLADAALQNNSPFSAEASSAEQLSTFPQYTKEELSQFQKTDPVISRFLIYWNNK